MRTENIFATGAQVTGASFFGRYDILNAFERSFLQSATRGISLVGPTRIGKSSLVGELGLRLQHQPSVICFTLCMGEMDAAHGFWYTVVSSLQSALDEKGLLDDTLSKQFASLQSLFALPYWYTPMTMELKSLLKRLHQRNLLIILNLDEFDHAPKVFDGETSHFQLLRTLYSGSEYNVKGLLISRRQLPNIESNSQGISTFHGVFDEYLLGGFSEDDLESVYAALSDYDLFLDADVIDRLKHYADAIPYLWCLFLHELVERAPSPNALTADIIDAIFVTLMPKIQVYYHDLIVRLKDDGHLDNVVSCCQTRGISGCETSFDAYHRKVIIPLEALGILHHSVYQGVDSYYAYTRDFSMFLQLEPLNLPIWDKLMVCEHKLKDIFLNVYPNLAILTYQDLQTDAFGVKAQAQQWYPDISLNTELLLSYCHDLNHYKPNPSITDVFTLGFVVNQMLRNWRAFAPYFPGDTTLWQRNLESIRDVRKPLAHGQRAHISSNTIQYFQTACETVIQNALLSCE